MHTVGKNIGNPKRFYGATMRHVLRTAASTDSGRNGGQKDRVTNEIFNTIDLLQYQISSIHIFL